MIDLFVTVLGRPRNVAPLVASFRAHSPEMAEITFICSPGDWDQQNACRESGENVLIANWEPGPGDYARKMNFAYSNTERPWVFLGADDISFTHGWMEAALGLDADVIATNDLANAQVARGLFGTHCFVRRSYVDALGGSADGPGSLLHTGYDHNYVDRELCGMAQSRGRFRFAKDSHVPHRHPLWHSARWDPTYKKALKHAQADRTLFYSRAHLWNYFGLEQVEKQIARRAYRDIVRQP